MKIAVVNGFPQVGKDEFVRCCLSELGAFGKLISTVDFVKEIAARCGWDGTKDSKNRKFLSDLKDLLSEWNDVPWKKVVKEIDMFAFMMSQYDMPTDNCIIFIHSREPKEIERFEKELGAISILIRRKSVEFSQQSNHADSEVLNHRYNYIIDNKDSIMVVLASITAGADIMVAADYRSRNKNEIKKAKENGLNAKEFKLKNKDDLMFALFDTDYYNETRGVPLLQRLGEEKKNEKKVRGK